MQSALGEKILRNIEELEHFLPMPPMHNILLAIVVADEQPESIASSYQLACWANNRQGEAITSERPALVWRAEERKPFVNWLARTYKSEFANIRAAERFVEDLIAGTPPSRSRALLAMTPHIAWVTWNRCPHSPIDTVASAQEVRDYLGLDPLGRNRSEPILLLHYQAPLNLLKPTIADAELFWQFEPPPEDFTNFGLIRPLTAEIPRRPEAIHEPAHFRDLDVVRMTP
jgi:hypothetical protein